MRECIYYSESFNMIFKEYLVRISNQRTAYEYEGYVILLCNYCCKDFLEITKEDAMSFFNYMESKRQNGTLSGKTICVRLSCYRALTLYIQKNHPELELSNAFLDIKRPDVSDEIQQINIPSMKELDAVMSVAKEEPMYYCIIAMATRTALSASNIVKLTLNNIKIIDGQTVLQISQESKKKEDIFVRLPEDVIMILSDYMDTLDENLLDSEGHLFYNKHKHALTIKNLDDAVARILKKSGLENKYTMKDFRTRAVLEYAKAGATEHEIVDYTGLGELRIRSFYRAASKISDCPASLVNYSLRSFSE